MQGSVEQMLARALRGGRLTVLLGAPGVGKSELLHTGVLPLLARRAGDRDRPPEGDPHMALSFPDRRSHDQEHGSRELLFVVDQWSEAALESLTRALDERPTADLVKAMSPAHLSALSRLNGDARLLIVLDHFEQLFEDEVHKPELRRFIEAWAAAAQSRDLGAVHFLIAVDERVWPRMQAVRAGIQAGELRLFRLHAESGGRVLEALTDERAGPGDTTTHEAPASGIDDSIDDIVSKVAKSVRDARAAEPRPEDVAASMDAIVRRVAAAAEAEREAQAAPPDDLPREQDAAPPDDKTRHAAQTAGTQRPETPGYAAAQPATEAQQPAQAQQAGEADDAERRAQAERQAEAARQAAAAQAQANRLAQALAAAEAAALREAQARLAAEAAAKAAQAEQRAEAERNAEAARQTEAARLADARRLADALAAAEAAAAREAQARQAAEAERQAEAARNAEAARQIEAARLAEARRLADALAAAEAAAAREAQARQAAEAAAKTAQAEWRAEAEQRAKAERDAEAARQTEAARLAEARRLAQALAAAEAAAVRERQAREAGEATLSDAVTRAASAQRAASSAPADDVAQRAAGGGLPGPAVATARPARIGLGWATAGVLATVTVLMLWWSTRSVSPPAVESAASPAPAASPAGTTAESPAAAQRDHYKLLMAIPSVAHARITSELASALSTGPAATRVAPLASATDPIAALAAPGHLAIAHLDALRAARTDATRRLRVLTPLFQDAVLFVVRADSPLQHLHDLRGRALSIGPVRGDGAHTVRAIYRQLFGEEIADPKQFDDDQALAELVAFRSIDAVALIVPQASAWWASLDPATARRLRVLTLDPLDPADRRLSRALGPSVVRTPAGATKGKSTTTPAVMSFLVASGEDAADVERLTSMAHALCRELPWLRQHGHAKWRELRPAAQVDTGWPVVRPFQATLSRCAPPDGAPRGTRRQVQ